MKYLRWAGRNLLPYAGLAAIVALILGTRTLTPVDLTAPYTATWHPSAHRELAARFTCKTREFWLTNNGASTGYAWYSKRSGRLQMADNYNELCENPAGGISVQINLTGTDDCLTYAGAKSGRVPLGRVVRARCDDKVSQQWDYYGNGLLRNDYTGWCLDGPRGGRYPFMNACDVKAVGELWYAQGS